MNFSGLANLDIHWLVKEFEKELVGGWFSKMWKVEGGYKVRIRTNKNNDIIILPPKAIFTTKYAYTGETPPSFVMKVRKELDNAKLVRVNQPNFDRLVEFEFENGKRLIVELFSKGNVVLVSESGKTLVAHRYESWKDREIKPNREYKYPTSEGLDPRDMSIEEFEGIFNNTDVIHSLIRGVKLGNRYLEEACKIAGVQKTAKEPENVPSLYKTIKSFLNRYEPGIQSGIPVSFKLETIGGTFSRTETMSEAVDSTISRAESKSKQKNPKLEKLRVRLNQQMKALEQMKIDEKRYKQIGDLIYSHYNEVDELLKAIRELNKGGVAWREIESRLGVKIIEKEGKVIVDL